ncbi:MAG: PepSY domain-containing protein [Steroidobacteraceae bacterium]
MRFSPRAFVLVAAIATAMTAGVAVVRADEQPQAVTLGSSMSLEQAVKMAEQRFQARVVRAEAQQDGGNTIYVLRMLNDSGRVWVVRVNASNGSVM